MLEIITFRILEALVEVKLYGQMFKQILGQSWGRPFFAASIGQLYL